MTQLYLSPTSIGVKYQWPCQKGCQNNAVLFSSFSETTLQHFIEKSCQEVQDDSYADAEEEGRRREHEMRGRGVVEEKVESQDLVEKGAQEEEEVEERKEEGGLKSIEAIAIKLVSSAEQERRGSREEPIEEEEEERRNNIMEKKEEGGADIATDVNNSNDNTNENVFRCSNAMLKTLSTTVSEPVLLSASGCNPGRKSV